LPPLALAYHGVAEVELGADPHGLFVPPRDLRRHVGRLRDWGYTLTTFGVLARLAAEGAAGGHAALTFDDGLADNLHTLLPLLDELQAPATVFAVSGWLGRPHPDARWTRLLTEDELRELAHAGVEIGSHGESHRDLGGAGFDEALAELARSKQALAEVVGAPIEVAAYPYGRASVAARHACRAAGYRAACRSTAAGSWSDPFNLPRQDMDRGSTLLGLRLKRDDRYEQLMQLRAARAVRRAVRRMRAAVA
jgi:peptidoglycan/xylan/chitin deacetylase (PgdA/CDA1 family)